MMLTRWRFTTTIGLELKSLSCHTSQPIFEQHQFVSMPKLRSLMGFKPDQLSSRSVNSDRSPFASRHIFQYDFHYIRTGPLAPLWRMVFYPSHYDWSIAIKHQNENLTYRMYRVTLSVSATLRQQTKKIKTDFIFQKCEIFIAF